LVIMYEGEEVENNRISGEGEAIRVLSASDPQEGDKHDRGGGGDGEKAMMWVVRDQWEKKRSGADKVGCPTADVRSRGKKKEEGATVQKESISVLTPNKSRTQQRALKEEKKPQTFGSTY